MINNDILTLRDAEFDLERTAEILQSSTSIEIPSGFWVFASTEAMDIGAMFRNAPMHIKHKSGDATVIWVVACDPYGQRSELLEAFAVHQSITQHGGLVTPNEALGGFNLPIRAVLPGEIIEVDGGVELVQGDAIAHPISAQHNPFDFLDILNEARNEAELEPLFAVDPNTLQGVYDIVDAYIVGLRPWMIVEAIERQNGEERIETAKLAEHKLTRELAELIRSEMPPIKKPISDYDCLRLTAKTIRVFENQNHARYAELPSGELVLSGAARVTDAIRSALFMATGIFQREPRIKSALALQSAEKITTARRVAYIGRTYFIDIGDDSNDAYAVAAGRWWVEKAPPVRFLRAASAGALPRVHPEKADGDVGKLFDVINVAPEDEVLAIAWLIEALRPESPYPALQLSGAAGSGKSTTARILRDVIDPRKTVHLAKLPNDQKDLAVAIASNHVAAFDNMSALSAKIQDLFCMFATGSTQIHRKLYSDCDEVELHNHAPCILNGINELSTRPDLQSRTIPIALQAPESHRKLSDINHTFEQTRGQILAGLLDVFADALGSLNQVGASSHRLSDFDQMGRAVSLVMHGDENVFVRAFESKAAGKSSTALEANVAAQAVLDYFELNTGIDDLRGSSGVVMNLAMHGSRHYSSSRFFKNDLMRVKNELAEAGIMVQYVEKRAKVSELIISRIRTVLNSTEALTAELNRILDTISRMPANDIGTVMSGIKAAPPALMTILEQLRTERDVAATRSKLQSADALLASVDVTTV